MVKCLNIGKNIGKPIYRSISSYDLTITACGFIKSIISKQFHHPVIHINHNSFKNSQKPCSYDWWSADFSDHVTKTARSCRFALFNIKKIRSFSQNMQHISLFRLLFCPDWIIAMLSWQIYQTFTINPERSSKINFNELKRTHIISLFINLHWLPIAACIKFKALNCPQNHLWLCTLYL